MPASRVGCGSRGGVNSANSSTSSGGRRSSEPGASGTRPASATARRAVAAVKPENQRKCRRVAGPAQEK